MPTSPFFACRKKLALISVQCQIPISSTINPCFQNPAPAPVSKWKNQARREPSKPGHWLYLMCAHCSLLDIYISQKTRKSVFDF